MEVQGLLRYGEGRRGWRRFYRVGVRDYDNWRDRVADIVGPEFDAPRTVAEVPFQTSLDLKPGYYQVHLGVYDYEGGDDPAKSKHKALDLGRPLMIYLKVIEIPGQDGVLTREPATAFLQDRENRDLPSPGAGNVRRARLGGRIGSTYDGKVAVSAELDMLNEGKDRRMVWRVTARDPADPAKVLYDEWLTDQAFDLEKGVELKPTLNETIELEPGSYLVEARLYHLRDGLKFPPLYDPSEGWDRSRLAEVYRDSDPFWRESGPVVVPDK